MIYLWRFTHVNGYLYTVSGIVSCVVSGYCVSMITGGQDRNLRGLTLFTLDNDVAGSPAVGEIT